MKRIALAVLALVAPAMAKDSSLLVTKVNQQPGTIRQNHQSDARAMQAVVDAPVVLNDDTTLPTGTRLVGSRISRNVRFEKAILPSGDVLTFEGGLNGVLR